MLQPAYLRNSAANWWLLRRLSDLINIKPHDQKVKIRVNFLITKGVTNMNKYIFG
jgi:hypothetical protein